MELKPTIYLSEHYQPGGTNHNAYSADTWIIFRRTLRGVERAAGPINQFSLPYSPEWIRAGMPLTSDFGPAI